MTDNLAAILGNRIGQSQAQPLKSNSAPSTPVSFKSQDGSLKKLETASQNGQDEPGPSISMAVHANDDDSFHKSSFNLKRTRSMGLLDEYIDPTKKLLGRADDGIHGANSGANRGSATDDTSTSVSNKDISQNEQPMVYSRQVSEDEDGEVDDDDADDQADDEGNYEDELEEIDEDYDHNRTSSRRDRTENEWDDSNRSMSVSPPPADNDSILLPQDDNDLVREPERHVDYLSHEWSESDISNSWKYIILKKKKKSSVDHVNAARLENASWRTWAKARNHLRTVSPEIVNWSKDSDVTWLYGPIVREGDSDDKDVEMGYGSDDETSKRMSTPKSKKKDSHAPKPILKKRTVQEILEENSLWKLSEARKHRFEGRHSISAIDAATGIYDSHEDYDDYDALAAKVNAQYYGPERSNSGENIPTSNKDNSSSNEESSIGRSGSREAVPQAEDPLASSVGGDHSKDGALKTILMSSNDDGTGSKSNKPGRDRHIHFNDRVEQCMAVADPESDSDYINSEYDQGDEYEDSYGSTSIIGGKGGETLAQAAKLGRSNSLDSSSSDEEDGNEENTGLFITPAMPRKSDSATHSPITDHSSTGSLKTSKISLHPIIKLLPATSLNYGSDDEAADNSDYNGYGSSVSHNVNTYRGYDYMYDYNSVYTGDTSSFLPVENCDVVDVPEGIGLHSAIAGENPSSYEFNHSALSDLDQEMQAEEEQKKHQQQSRPGSFLNNESDNSGFDSDDQFIEDTQYPSSDEEEDGGLRRAVSLGKTSSSGSLRDLPAPQPLNTVNPPSRTCSFISGKPLDSGSILPVRDFNLNDVNDIDGNNGNHKDLNAMNNNNNEDGSNFHDRNDTSSYNEENTKQVSPHSSLKRVPSSSFIFNSESEEDEEDEDDDDDGDENDHGIVNYNSKDSNRHSQRENTSDLPELSLQSRSKTGPPQSSVILPTTSKKSASTAGPQLSDLSKSIRIKNSLSPAEVGASDVAINGSFSPVNESIKSVVTNKGIIDREASSSSSSATNNNKNANINTNNDELRDVNKNLQDCHIDENGSSGVGDQWDTSESVQKMMQNAREIANKYLHSWKKGEGNSQGTRSDNKSS